MHIPFFPLLAAFLCALCNGTAVVLQKISASKIKPAKNLNPKLVIKLIQDVPYSVGLILDIIGWVLTLYAVRSLPLFLVEAVIASNIAVTAILDRIWRKQILGMGSYVSIMVILLGLGLLGLVAAPEHTQGVSLVFSVALLISVGLIVVLSWLIIKKLYYFMSIGLAVLSGFAYGQTSIIGRIFNISHPVWKTIFNPLVLGVIVSGGLGILLFSAALQRGKATIVNATMTVSQTVIPSSVGIIFLGDRAQHGLEYAVILGSLMVLGGILSLIRIQPELKL